MVVAVVAPVDAPIGCRVVGAVVWVAVRIGVSDAERLWIAVFIVPSTVGDFAVTWISVPVIVITIIVATRLRAASVAVTIGLGARDGGNGARWQNLHTWRVNGRRDGRRTGLCQRNTAAQTDSQEKSYKCRAHCVPSLDNESSISWDGEAHQIWIAFNGNHIGRLPSTTRGRGIRGKRR